MRKLNINSSVIVAILIVFIATTSCQDYLTVAPENDLIKEKFWTKTEDVNSALAATYNAMREASLQSLIFGEVRADMVEFTGGSFADYAKIGESNISPTNPVVNWKAYYAAINLANTLMFYDKEVFEKDKTFTKEMMDAIDAEALFIRSLAYFYLVRIWKDVPLVLDASISDTTDLYINKSSEKVVVNQIINDLLKAKDMAYETQFQGSNYFYGRANKYSIMALLADVYLWNEQYDKCYEYCDLIINSGLYGLESSDNMFRIYYPGNSAVESIIELQYNDALDDQENPIYYELVPIQGGGAAQLNTKNVTAIMAREDRRHFEGQEAIWKYRGKDALGLVNRASTERDANWNIYRYADIMLMKAEAAIELNKFDEANNLIRETLLRAGMPYEDIFIKEDLRQALLDEKGREFLFEGKRWFDLLRAAKRNKFQQKDIIINMILAGADIKQQAVLRTKVYDTLSYYLPIAERELIYNQNLVQNPYYDR
ncbi:MAG TPA: RagB/SusD family nutrient uptake outer membrane protein [Draconibacterium sp.]|nr:RagB/SusD family nutrient uptake outer membrane protein [Draconibacterium sp.]